MLPAWAAITITLGGAAITGLVALVGTRATVTIARIHVDQSRREAWEIRRLEACETLSGAAAGVLTRLAAQDLDGAKEARNQVVAALARVSFLFGPDSPVTGSGEALSKAVGEFVRNPADLDWHKRFPDDPFDGFYKAVHAAMQPPGG